MRHVSRPLGRRVIALVAFAALLPAPAWGQTSTWTNAAGGLWSVPGNWDIPPAVGGSPTTQLIFGLSATYTATNDLAGIFNLNSILFTSNAGVTNTVAATGGSSLNFTGLTPFISMDNAGNAIISSPISFDADLTHSGVGTGSLTLSGAVTNASGANNLIKSATGDLFLSGGGSFRQLSLRAGNTTIGGGTLALTAPTEANNTAGLQLGQAAGQTATVNISGATTIVNVTENTYLGDIAGSTGVMNVSNGAIVNSGTQAGGVSGRLAPGNFGTGTLNITSGGVVNAMFLFQSRQVGSNGTILVDGPGSQLNIITVAGVLNSGQTTFGSQGVGIATISNGGVVTGRNIILGNTGITAGPPPTGEGNGFVTVTGSGSMLIAGGPQAQNSAGQIVVGAGNAGSTGTPTGRLDILAGGQVIVNTNGAATPAGGNFLSAQQPNSVGTTNVSGTGSLLQVANQMALGVAASPANAATVNIDSGGVVQVGGAAFIFSGGVVNVNAGGTYRAGVLVDGVAGNVGNINTLATGVVQLPGIANTTGTYTGVIGGAGSLTKSGVGGQILAGTNTYTGGTTVTGGQLAIVGSIPGGVNVNGGTLSGASIGPSLGRVAGAVTVNTGGTLSGGDGTATNLTGVFNITGAVTMNSGSTLSIGINGNTPGAGTTNHDQISLVGGGSMVLGAGIANLDAGANTNALTPADMIVIVNGGTVSGTFMNLPNGTQFMIPNAAGMPGINDFYLTTITYNPTNIVLSNFMPVPEPVHILAFAGLAAAGIGWRKRRKK
jgi:autotransporter-associated beta strand protein